jgi:8-oxo-dGTP pyrophosphatase MutT (NUDIX family)
MRTVKTLADEKFLKLKKVVDPENNVGGYLFAERLGVDSIAFVCYDQETAEVLVNNEYKPPVNEFISGAFGGSLDKDSDMVDIVIAEVKEEAGFVVTNDDIVPLGKVFVSTQMNQYCYLFLVIVDKRNQEEREPENAIEAMATTKWIDVESVFDLEDWKAPLIVTKAVHESLKL